MKREINLAEVTDGKRYQAGDLVKAACGDCEGCHACCQGMGESLLLDPMDIYRLSIGLKKTFQELLGLCLELHVVDGVILPNMRMAGEGERCPFLNGEGRCSIHDIRPGICRLFPLGRLYEEGSFSYFLQTQECPKEPKTKVKIRKWLQIPELPRYEAYISTWHYFLKDLEHILETVEPAMTKKILLYILETFYQEPYEAGDFYSQFEQRMQKARQYVGMAG